MKAAMLLFFILPHPELANKLGITPLRSVIPEGVAVQRNESSNAAVFYFTAPGISKQVRDYSAALRDP
jgi:hypothetical protein